MMHTHIYRGGRTPATGCLVYVEDIGSEGQVLRVRQLLLEPSLKIRAHSPTGFEWGYHGSGPAQLALAIMLDATGSARLAEQVYQQFKFDHVSKWPNAWEISSDEIFTWLAASNAVANSAREHVNDDEDAWSWAPVAVVEPLEGGAA